MTKKSDIPAAKASKTTRILRLPEIGVLTRRPATGIEGRLRHRWDNTFAQRLHGQFIQR